MKMNIIKSAMTERVEAAHWSETDTMNVLQKIREEKHLTKKRTPTVLSVTIILLLILAATVLAGSKWGMTQWLSDNYTTEVISTAKPEIIQQAEYPPA